jgi:hypothetical protein
LDEEGNLRSFEGIPRAMTIRELSTFQLKKSHRKGCRVFTAHMEEEPKDKVSSVEDYAVLKEFEDVFKEIPRFPSKIDINFFINLMPGKTLVSKTPYRMSTGELKEL